MTTDTQAKPRFPIDMSEDTPGMKCSLSGVLDRAAGVVKRSRDYKHLEFSLNQLHKHIEMLRASESDEDALNNLHQFLKLWV